MRAQGKFFLTVGFQLISVEGVVGLENTFW